MQQPPRNPTRNHSQPNDSFDDAADFLQYHYAFGDETCFSDNPFLQEHIVPEVRTYDISPLDD